MKVLEARIMRLSEGICPACDEPLARGREDGICNCCGYTYRLRDSKVEGRHQGEWLLDGDLPQSCHGGETMVVDGMTFNVDRIHTFHLGAPDYSVSRSSHD